MPLDACAFSVNVHILFRPSTGESNSFSARITLHQCRRVHAGWYTKRIARCKQNAVKVAVPPHAAYLTSAGAASPAICRFMDFRLMADPLKHISVRGAREHNLKDVSVDLPRDELIVFTGLSGSGKSSLAFDTIYAEGQRRYVESLSAYARQFLELMSKPDVDSIEGLSPAISIEQKTTSKNPR